MVVGTRGAPSIELRTFMRNSRSSIGRWRARSKARAATSSRFNAERTFAG